MTHASRQLHRRAVCAVAVLVPLVILGAAAVRSPEPRASVVPLGVEMAGSDLGTLFSSDDLWRRSRISTRILIRPGDPDRRWIELDPREEFAHSDLLLYWSTVRPRERLSPSARLLGALRGNGSQRFVIPDSVDLRAGYLILYDFSHSEIFGIAEVPTQL